MHWCGSTCTEGKRKRLATSFIFPNNFSITNSPCPYQDNLEKKKGPLSWLRKKGYFQSILSREINLDTFFAGVVRPQLWVCAGVDSNGTTRDQCPRGTQGTRGLLWATFPTVPVLTFRVAPVANSRMLYTLQEFHRKPVCMGKNSLK